MGDKRKVIVDGKEFEVDVERSGDVFTATVKGKTFTIEVPEAPKMIQRKSSRGGTKKKSGKISANIPGKISTIDVNVGDEVQEGQVVLILEAMKMQNEIQAPLSGRVAEVNCESGDSVEANTPLVVIEPPE